MKVIPTNATEEIRVEIGEYKRRPVLNVRKWWRGRDGQMRPGKDGIAMRAGSALNLAEAIMSEIDESGGGA